MAGSVQAQHYRGPGAVVNPVDLDQIYLDTGVVVTKTADETVTNSATLQDDDHLSFAVTASSKYLIELILLCTGASTTADFKLGFTLPASGTIAWQIDPLGSVAAASSPTAESTTTVSFGAISGNFIARASGLITIAGTAGTAQLQWAQNTQTNEANVLRAGSSLIYRKL